MQKLHQFKLLTLFSYQIILSGCVTEFLLSQPSYLITFILKKTTKISKLKTCLKSQREKTK